MTNEVTAGVVILQTVSNIQMHIKHDIPFKGTEKEPKGTINLSDIMIYADSEPAVESII